MTSHLTAAITVANADSSGSKSPTAAADTADEQGYGTSSETGLSALGSADTTATTADAPHQPPPPPSNVTASPAQQAPTSIIAASSTTTPATTTSTPNPIPIPIPISKTRQPPASTTPLASTLSSLSGSRPPSPRIIESAHPASQPISQPIPLGSVPFSNRRPRSSTTTNPINNNPILTIRSTPPTPIQMELPERLRDGDESNDDRDDVPQQSVAPGAGARLPLPANAPMSYDMSHSVFGMLHAAATQMDSVNDRFFDAALSSDDGNDVGALRPSPAPGAATAIGTHALGADSGPARSLMARSMWHDKPSAGPSPQPEGKEHKRRFSDTKMFRSLMHLRPKSLKKPRGSESDESQSADAANKGVGKTPVMGHQSLSESEESQDLSQSRILSPPSSTGNQQAAAAAAESSPSIESSDTVPPMPLVSPPSVTEAAGAATSPAAPASVSRDDDESVHQLSLRLQQVFEFEEVEPVINDYPCWLLQSVLLQGTMYVTSRHVCFYAYLPRKQALVKSGNLYKTGKRNPKYSRYWFSLKGDVLTYSSDASNIYFPSGQIDLRHAIEARISEKDREGIHFTVETPRRVYYLRADSAPSANDWVKCIQRVILRSRNDGDSVKISLPIDNIVDIEVAPMVDFAETCRLRVIDNDETYAIDDYFFSFFNLGKEAIRVLRILVEGNQGHSDEDRERQSGERPSSHVRPPGSTSAHGHSHRRTESVKATLQPPERSGALSPRSSSEVPRSSFDVFKHPHHRGRRSVDVSRSTNHSAATSSSHEPPTTRRSFATARRSFSGSRILGGKQPDPKSSDPHASSESYVQSSMSVTEDNSLSAMAADSTMLEDQTASQILRASDMFQGPTLLRREGDEPDSQRQQQPTSPLPSQGQKQSRPPSPPTPSIMSSPISASAPNEPASGLPSDGDGEPQHQIAQQNNAVAKLGTSPLQRAGAWATYVNQTGRRVGSLLATESMGYVEKVSGMWKGGRRHYSSDAAGVDHQPGEHDESTPDKIALDNQRFRHHFLLPESEKLQSTYFGYIVRVLPLYGKLYVSNSYLCFRSLLPGMNTKLVLPLRDVENVEKEGGFRFGYHGLVLVVRAHEELFFEFTTAAIRDDCAVTLLRILDRIRYLKETGQLTDRHGGGGGGGPEGDGGDAGEGGDDQSEDGRVALAECHALNETRSRGFPEHELKLPTASSTVGGPVIVYDDMTGSTGYKPPRKNMHITCLTIGSRGDVQPYIALAKGLMAEGHRVRIATHAEFQAWIEGHGVEFRPIAGDPAQLMRLCIENGTFSLSFMREAHSSFRAWLDEVLTTAWEACRGTELLIESPSAMAGIHIAEALDIPYFRAFTMPWTRTRAYPHAFIMPSNKMGGTYNISTYIMFENLFWRGMQSQVNKWRAGSLGLPPTSHEKLQTNKVPFLYNFSPLVVPPPLDYSDWIRVTGYWFLNEGSDWQPPQELLDFIARARADGKKLVYVGFGSIIVPDPAAWTRDIIDAVLKADVRCIFSTGWSDRLSADQGSDKDDKGKAKAKDTADQQESAQGQQGAPAVTQGSSPTPSPSQAQALSRVVIPPEIHVIKSAPHDWLFSQVDAAAHHGGSGTTGASLRAGIPTIIRPIFGDQFFFANRVQDTGVGIYVRKQGSMPFARALWRATHEERMITKARVLGESIRQEDGVGTAIQAIYRDYGYARGLIAEKRRSPAHRDYAARHMLQTGDDGTAAIVGTDGMGSGDEDEPWTFIGHVPQNEDDPGALRLP